MSPFFGSKEPNADAVADFIRLMPFVFSFTDRSELFPYQSALDQASQDALFHRDSYESVFRRVPSVVSRRCRVAPGKERGRKERGQAEKSGKERGQAYTFYFLLLFWSSFASTSTTCVTSGRSTSRARVAPTADGPMP